MRVKWFAAAWALSLTVGLSALWTYAGAKGAAGMAPESLPAILNRANKAGKATLIIALHPRCFCSRASLSELSEFMTLTRGRVAALALFYRPAQMPPEWARTDLWRTAAAIGGLTVADDPDGLLARSLGARTSGQVVLYDRSGRLLYSGGITGARGHAGDNVGFEAALARLNGSSKAPRRAGVYGCSLAGGAR